MTLDPALPYLTVLVPLLALGLQGCLMYLLYRMFFRAPKEPPGVFTTAYQTTWVEELFDPFAALILLMPALSVLVYGTITGRVVTAVSALMWAAFLIGVVVTTVRAAEVYPLRFAGIAAFFVTLGVTIGAFGRLGEGHFVFTGAVLIGSLACLGAIWPRRYWKEQILDGLTERNRRRMQLVVILGIGMWGLTSAMTGDQVLAGVTVVAAAVYIVYRWKSRREYRYRRITTVRALAMYESVRYRFTGFEEPVTQETVTYLDELMRHDQVTVAQFLIHWERSVSLTSDRDLGMCDVDPGTTRQLLATRAFHHYVGYPDVWALADHIAPMSRHSRKTWRYIAREALHASILTGDSGRLMGAPPYGNWDWIGQHKKGHPLVMPPLEHGHPYVVQMTEGIPGPPPAESTPLTDQERDLLAPMWATVPPPEVIL